VIIFESIGSILNSFEVSSIFEAAWAVAKIWLKIKIEPSLANLACLNQ
jgi:hypothetical protein